MLSFLGIIIGFIVAANYFGLAARGFTLNFGSLFLLNLALIISLIIYDTLVIDWIVIGHWRPGFLKLPATMNKAEMRDHIRKTIIAGPVFGTLLALASTTISYFTWM